jgi:hypothetical protein
MRQWSSSSKVHRREGLTCNCTDEAGYIYSSPLHICRVVLLAAASRRWPWRTATGTWPKQIFRDRTRPLQACFSRCRNSRGWSGKTTLFSRSGYTRARHRNFLYPEPNCHTEFLTFLRSSPTSPPACSQPPGCFNDASTCFTTRPQATSTYHARCSSTSSPA